MSCPENIDAIGKLVGEYKTHILREDGTLDERMLFQLCNEVDRRARHLAVRSIQSITHVVNDGV